MTVLELPGNATTAMNCTQFLQAAHSGTLEYKKNGGGKSFPLTVTTSSCNPLYDWVIFFSFSFLSHPGSSCRYRHLSRPYRLQPGKE